MNLSQFTPPQWLISLSLLLLVLSFIMRAKYSLTRNGRLLIFVCLPMVWLAAIYLGAYYKIGGLADPETLKQAGRITILSMFLIQALANFLVAWEEHHIRVALDKHVPGWRKFAA